jgi:hypothetical protein
VATCRVCGSTLAHFQNPPRDICPTPERHRVTEEGKRLTGAKMGASNKGKVRGPKRK